MKIAKRILFLVSGILSIFASVTFAILSICFIAFSNNEEAMQELADKSTDGVTPEEFQAVFLALGVMFVVFLIAAIINIILSFKGRNSDSKGVMIANIVFGAISGIVINIVAAIFGLIARNQGNSSPKIENEY